MDASINVELCIFPSGIGLLRWFLSFRADPIDLALPARFVRVICLLQEAMELDQAGDIPPLLRGYRKAEAIARMYDSVPPEKTTITRYLSDTCRLIAAMPGTVPLIERVPYRGARLLYPVKLTRLQAGTSLGAPSGLGAPGAPETWKEDATPPALKQNPPARRGAVRRRTPGAP